MIYLVTAIHIIVCLFIIIVVLLQSGKSGDISAAFGGQGSQTAFGPRGAASERRNLITYVKDRPGHDRRYAINAAKIGSELGWKPSAEFESGLRKTVHWYLEHPEWVRNVRTGDYLNWITKNYAERATR